MQFISIPDTREVCIATMFTWGTLYLVNSVIGDVIEEKKLLNLNNINGQLFQLLQIEAKPSQSVQCFLKYLSDDKTSKIKDMYNFVISSGDKITMLKIALNKC